MRAINLLFLLLLLVGLDSWSADAQTRNIRGEELVLDDNNGNTITIETPTGMTGSWSFVLPADGGTAGQVLTTDGAGGFTWAAPAGGGGAIPTGYMILDTSPTVPTGFSAAGEVKADFWENRAAMTTARRGMGSGVVGGKIYVIGGATNAAVLTTNEEYDPTTNSWAAKAAMTTARSWPASAVYNNLIYIVGGTTVFSAFTTPTGANEEYNPATNTWAAKAAMPTAAMLSRGATVGAKIYVMGGFDGTNDLTNNREYDPVANTWAAKAAIPNRRDGFGIGVISGKIYIAGGYSEAPVGTFNVVDQTNEYDPGTNSWATKANMPAVRWVAASAVVNSKLFVIGGATPGAPQATNYSYNPATNQWAVNEPMAGGRKQAVAAAVGSRLFVIGGTNQSGDFSGRFNCERGV